MRERERGEDERERERETPVTPEGETHVLLSCLTSPAALTAFLFPARQNIDAGIADQVDVNTTQQTLTVHDL